MEGITPKDNTLLTAYLNEYIRMTKPQFAVMITGKWGCGKTYYIDRMMDQWEKEKVRTDANSIRLKPVYVSVYGLQTIAEVVRQIKIKLYPVLYSKGAKVFKKVALTGLQILTKSKVDFDKDGSGEDFNSLLDAEGILEIFKSDSSSIKGQRILVFDDLERSRIPLDEFFGFVNNIVEHSNSKVILICEENKLKESADKDIKESKLKVEYKDFKEKLVGQTFALAVDYAQLATSFIDASGSKILKNNQGMIVSLFIASKCENLRIIKHCLLDIQRFFDQLPDGMEKNANYALFEKNVVAYLVIASIEERIGTQGIDSFQSYSVFDEKHKASQKDIEDKYNGVLEYYQLFRSQYSITVGTLLSFIRTGYVEAPESIMKECRLLQSRRINNWEKLWRNYTLSNDEFSSLLATEKARFYNKELEYSFEVAHLAGILLSLEKRGLVKLSRKHVVSTAKANIAAIQKKYPNDFPRLAMNGQGFEFQESNSNEMKDVLSFASSFVQKQIEKTEKEYVVKAWEKLSPGMTHSDIDNMFDIPTPTHRTHYSYESLFTQVTPKVMAKKLLSLPNDTKMEFSYYLVSRYYLKGSSIIGELTEGMKKDKGALEKISTILKAKAKRLKLIEKEVTLIMASKMDEAVVKM